MLRSTRTGTTTLAHQRNWPKGIYVVNGRDVAHDSLTFTHPYIDGVMRRSHWRTIEPTVGGDAGPPGGTKLNTSWGAVDLDVTRARASGKKVLLAVMSQMLSPMWALAGVTTMFQNVCGGGLSGNQYYQPLPWDDTYLTRWTTFVHTMGQRYDGQDMFVPICGAGSVSMEMGLQDTCIAPGAGQGGSGVQQLQDWINNGYKPSLMYSTWDRLAGVYTSAFPLGYTTAVTMQVLSNINEAGVETAGAGAATRNQIVANMRAAHGVVGRRMAVEAFGLSAADAPEPGPPGRQLVIQYSPTGPAGFEYQTSCWKKPLNMYIKPAGLQMDSPEAFQQTAEWGIAAGAQYLIVYEPDALACFSDSPRMMGAFQYVWGKLHGVPHPRVPPLLDPLLPGDTGNGPFDPG